MEKGAYVKDINRAGPVNGLFEAREASSGTTRNGDTFWRLRLCDATGSIPAVVWSPEARRISQLDDGVIVRVAGLAREYNGNLQIVVGQLARVEDDTLSELDKRDFRDAPPFDTLEMFSALLEECDREFTYPAWRRLVFSILEDDSLGESFKTCPAAKQMHHDYEGGLLEHSYSVFRLCGRIANHYGESLDRQALLAAALLHDIGKTRELSCTLGIDYTDVGRLQGHIYLGLELLEPFLRQSGLDSPLRDHFKHLILSHHGQLEFGSPCLPQTAEALALHFADDLDAKMARCRAAVKNTRVENGRWSEWQKPLERFIYLAAHTADFS